MALKLTNGDDTLSQFHRDVGNLNSRAQLRIRMDNRAKAKDYLRIVKGAVERALYILEHEPNDRTALIQARAVLKTANYMINPVPKRSDEL